MSGIKSDFAREQRCEERDKRKESIKSNKRRKVAAAQASIVYGETELAISKDSLKAKLCVRNSVASKVR